MSTTTKVSALYEGTFSVGLDKKFHRIDREDPPQKGALKVSINPFLVQTPGHTMLFDVGLGEFGEDTSCDTILENLEQHDVTEYDVTDIVVSHLHYDHLGGLAGKCDGFWELTFPDARLWVSEKGWEKVTAMETYYNDHATEFIHFLDAKADLHFLGPEEQPLPNLEIRQIGGHTEHHQVILYNDGTHKYMMAGDVIATRGHINRKFAAKYDYDSSQSMKARRELIELAYREQYLILAYHDSHHPIFKLTQFEERQGYTVTPYEETVTT